MSAAYDELILATARARKRGEDITRDDVFRLAERFGAEAVQAALRRQAAEMEAEAAALEAVGVIRHAARRAT